ncbi:MAG: hypothetical protein JSU88_01045 [Nitrospinaceae bacterium]|nr:MAG: hypothetical protein JSU88_01045 [Nitrospinaceae bacterium]
MRARTRYNEPPAQAASEKRTHMIIPLSIIRRIIHPALQPGVRLPLFLAVALVVMVFIFAGVFAWLEEGAGFGDGLWTAYITLTTIGYGDFSAKTLGGRVVTVLTSMIGIGCFGVFTGIIVEKAIKRRSRKMKGEGNYSGEGHLVIVNVPSYQEVKELLRELDLSPDFKDAPRVVLAESLPDMQVEFPGDLYESIDGFIKGPPSTLETLKRANLSHARACLFLSSAAQPALDDSNTLTAGLIERHWPQVITILACSRPDSLKNLRIFNIDGGINAIDLQMGFLVQELEDPGVFNVYSQLSSNRTGSQIYISRTPVSEWNRRGQVIGLGKLKQTIIALDLPTEIVGIKRQSEPDILLLPPNDLELLPSDRLVYMAKERFNWRGRGDEIVQAIEKIS